jgi:hypothetical protein
MAGASALVERAVRSAGMIEGLRKLYGAGALADELEGKR